MRLQCLVVDFFVNSTFFKNVVVGIDNLFMFRAVFSEILCSCIHFYVTLEEANLWDHFLLCNVV